MAHTNLVLTAVLVCCVNSVFAQEDFCPVEVPGKAFCDDFSDMMYDDDSPVTWIPGTFPDAVLDASSGDLVVTNDGLSSTFVDVDFRDVVIRTQLKFTENGGRAGVFGRGLSTNSITASITSAGLIRLRSLVGESQQIRGQFNTGLDPTTQYVNLQLSLIGRQYGLTVWAEGEQQPPDPQVVWDDIFNEFPNLNGGLGIWQNRSATRSTTYRFYEAVPEPSSAILLAIGAVGLFGHGLRRKKLSVI